MVLIYKSGIQRKFFVNCQELAQSFNFLVRKQRM